ncbi:MAG: alpha/beta fold hydrolase [Mycobacterium leprae]
MTDAHPLPTRDVVVAGVRVSVVDHGRPASPHTPPLLLLHGLPTSAYLWRDVMRDLGREHRAFAPDLVGLGRSERPRWRGYDLAAQARRLVGLLDALGVRDVVVVGHDLGGGVAVHLAATAADRVAGLVLADAPVHADVWPPPATLPLLVPGARLAWLGALRRSPALGRRVLARALGARVSPRELDTYLAPLLAPDGVRGLLRFVDGVDLAAVEGALRVAAADPPPALVLWGADDRLFSAAYGRRVAAALRAPCVAIPDAGHLVPKERPERVAEELGGFVAGLSRPVV